jgi:hypothetical protein
MSKLILAGAFATGYVLGAKAGRERYEQMIAFVAKVSDDPRVQGVMTKVENNAMNRYNASPPAPDDSTTGDTLVYSTGPDIEESVEELAPSNDAERL